MEDPNYEQTDIFAFMMEKPAGKKRRVRTKKAALSSEQKRSKCGLGYRRVPAVLRSPDQNK